MRIDHWLKENGKAPSRAKAQELIKSGYVYCDNIMLTKCSFEVSDESHITIKTNDVLKYVSRGGLKLEKALNTFELDFSNKTIMDIGSSTGGFTDCSLQNGASNVIAIDVGNNVMHKNLRNDSRIRLYENTNIKNIDIALLKNVDYIVCDVSFISLESAFQGIIKDCNMDMILLIKPQFECGKKHINNYNGIVRNKSLHIETVTRVVRFFEINDYFLQNISYSPITGVGGNIEYITLFSKKNNCLVTNEKIKSVINESFNYFKER